ncbi:MAG: hypothetical protein HY908_15360, partial [Myxococcales bacterium]|nr:hypothetical protein [Myxococcales bacterium]
MTDPTDTTQNARGIATWLGCVALWVLLGCRTGDPAPESQLTSGLAPSAAQQVASEEPRSLGGGALPFEVDAVVRRVHFAFRSDGAGWRGEHSTHRVAANAEGLAITPRHAPLPGVGATAPASPRAADSTAPIEGTPVHLATRSIARGPRPLGRGVARAELGREGQLVVDRGAGLREIVRNGEHGVEQSWTLESRPEGQGDLEVRVVVEGARLTGVTESGLHFADDASGLGVRYGHGTWIDAHGRRLAVRAAWEQGAVVLRVPAAALDAAAYPAELDPLISPEFGMDNPVMGVASSYQVAPAIAAGGGDYLVVWQDWRSGVDGDIVGARVSSAGVLLDPVGLTISAGPDKQSTPTVAFDGTSWLVAWVDSGAGIDHILGARVSTTGTLLDAAPLVISTATGGQSQPKVSAGAGQWLVVWRDLRNGPTLDIYGARVSSAGTVLDAGGIPICVVAYDQSEPTVAYNGTQWLVTWQDYRVGAYMDLYATRVSGAGVVQDPGGFVVAAAASWQQQPAAASDGSGWLVAWLDSRNGPSQIFCARVGADATVLDPVGTLVASAVWFRGEPEVAFDGTSYLVAWQDDRNGVDYDVFAARVSGGAVLDPGGFLVASAASAQATPAVAFAGSSWLVVWADARSGADWDIYGARVSATGAVLDPAGIPIARASNRQEAPAVSFGGSTWLVVWQDFRGGVDPDIYGVRVDGGGVVLDPSGIAISVAAGRQEAPSVAFDGSQWLVAWSDFRGGATADVYAARVSAAGAVLDPGGLPVSTATNHQQLPAVAFDGANWVVAWEDWRSWATLSRDVYAARVSPSGVVLDPAGIAVTATSAETLAPVIASDGTRTLVVWEDWRTFATTGQDVYGARLTQGGVVLDPAGVAITTGLSSQYGATVAFDGVQWLVAWQDLRAGNWDIYAARVSTAGSVLDPAGVPVSSVGSVAIAPSVAFDGTNTVVVWQDYRNGRSDLYGARLRLDASLVDATGVVLAAAPEDERAPRLARGVGRDVLLGYYRLEPALGSRRVFARRLAFGADAGVACAAASDCETAFCVDGVCCDSACGGAATDDCQACSVATGALADGVCGATTGNACSDADACTQSDACQAGSCVGGNPVVCVASDACHDAGSCDPANGTCSSPPKADGTDCADGDACTQTDTCQAGNCVGGNPVVCVAPDACHDAGSCDPANGTCSSPVKPDGTSCADGDACTQTDICQAGNCVGGNPVVCVAPDACHDAGSCDPANGSCSSPAKPDG